MKGNLIYVHAVVSGKLRMAHFSLDPPENLAVEVKYDQNNWAYFAITLDVPKSVQEVNGNLNKDFQYYSGVNAQPVRIRFDTKYGDHDWNQPPVSG